MTQLPDKGTLDKIVETSNIENLESDCKIEIRRQFINLNKNVGRNQLCPCGSGKKFKHCCLNKDRDFRVVNHKHVEILDKDVERKLKRARRAGRKVNANVSPITG